MGLEICSRGPVELDIAAVFEEQEEDREADGTIESCGACEGEDEGEREENLQTSPLIFAQESIQTRF